MNVNETQNNTIITNGTLTTISSEIAVPQTGEIITGVVVYSIIILLSIIGNVIVVIAILRVQRLRHPTNFILMSLAIADLLVTTTVMIPGFISEIKRKWIFGTFICKIWLGNDITFCTASILHLVAVSFDRYVAIENPLKYKQKMTKRTIFIIIGCIWLISVLISYGPIALGIYSESLNGEILSDPGKCRMKPDFLYSVVSATTSFYIPLIIILFLYGRIYITARQHSIELQKLENIIKRLHSDQKFVLESTKWNKNIKAIRTLGIVVGVFVACWLPFFVMYLLLGYCKVGCVYPVAERYITLIGYANSFCNPMIYAFSNKEFRNAFVEILNYQNCRCFPFRCGVRTSINKSIHSMNFKTTPPNYSRQTSITPHSNSLQRNGHLSYTSSSLCTSVPTKTIVVPIVDPNDGLEMQVVVHQRKTIEAFHELEHLVPNGLMGQVSLVRMSSLIQEQDDPISEPSIST
ncbi:hypothetical protein I4U23_014227 [Adineta vaga]|nr:hypothetical protein I4U23_014227 [Adineta vaga]